MSNVMPSQVVRTIDELFSHAIKGGGDGQLQAGHSPQLCGILSLVKAVPLELINVSSSDYADLVLATSTIEYHLGVWTARGNVGGMSLVKGSDAVSVIRRVLVQCPDEYPPPTTTELLFIKDEELRESIRRDVGAANRALTNSEWKAATVLAGAAIEALLLWKLQEHPLGEATSKKALADLVGQGSLRQPRNTDLESWDLHHYIAVANKLNVIKKDTYSAAKLAQNFRNLIHPGRSARLNQICDRATAYSGIGALEHVIRDIAESARPDE
jgi:hypothetical protein